MTKTIVCHSFPAWDAPYIKSTVELLKRLSADHRVIFIDYHYTWKDLFTSAHAPKKRLMGLQSRWRKLTTKHGEIEVYNSPPIIPVNWINSKGLFKFMSKLNALILKATFKRIRRRLNKEETVILNALNPVYGSLMRNTWKGFKTAYYCYDELSGTAWSSKWGSIFEKDMLQNADQVIVTSPKLLATKSKENTHCQIVKNGVNLDIFNNPPLSKSKNKMIGYVGAVDNRVDSKLIADVARAMPDHEFWMVGPVSNERAVEDWNGLSNINCMGRVDQDKLPEIIGRMDACIIPFVKNELTAAIYPLKINEYLAMGKPVVGTSFSDLSDFDTLISLADTADSFTEALQRELKGNTRYRIQKRIKFARANSWDARAGEMEKCLA